MTRAWKVERLLGRGGAAHVYLGRPVDSGSLGPVALKVLADTRDPEVRARFLHEGLVLASLSEHPSFVRVVAQHVVEGRPCLEMEYVPGVTLDRALAAAGPIPAAAAIELGRQVSGALHVALHRARDVSGSPLGVLHRDLKPANLRVTPTGQVKVLDFGLARSGALGERPETRSILAATVQYMAPERFCFRSDFGPPADVYALGLVLFEMLLGEPFLDLEVISPLRPAEPEALTEWTRSQLDRLWIVPGAPAGLAELLGGMLAIEPGDRPTAEEVERRCRHLGGMGLEDAWRGWIDGAFRACLAEGEPPPDPWGWVGTVRSAEAAPAAAPSARRFAWPLAVVLAAAVGTWAATRLGGDAVEDVAVVAVPDARSGEEAGEAVVGVEVADVEPDGGAREATGRRVVARGAGGATGGATEGGAPAGAAGAASGGATAAEAVADAVSGEGGPDDAAGGGATAVQAEIDHATASMDGHAALSVRLEGPTTLELRPGDRSALPPGRYSAHVRFEGGDYREEIDVPRRGSVRFDCTRARMGRPCVATVR